MESTKEIGSRAAEGPTLCINNCGFFGSAATMNMCSKCHKDTILENEQAKLAATSFENIVNGGTSTKDKETIFAMESSSSVELKVVPPPQQQIGPNRCNSCRKRVGLTGFNCRCGNLFCSIHRYSDKHECPFDYQAAARDSIAKSNPLVKAEKVDKI